MAHVVLHLDFDLSDYFSEVGFDGDVILLEMGKYWSGKAVDILNMCLVDAFEGGNEGVKAVTVIAFPPRIGLCLRLKKIRKVEDVSVSVCSDPSDWIQVKIQHGETDLEILNSSLNDRQVGLVRKAYAEAYKLFDEIVTMHYKEMLGS